MTVKKASKKIGAKKKTPAKRKASPKKKAAKLGKESTKASRKKPSRKKRVTSRTKAPVKRKAPAKEKAPRKRKVVVTRIPVDFIPRNEHEIDLRDVERDKGGRPKKYYPALCEQARRLCLLFNSTVNELADFMQVDRSTLYQWKLDYPAFSDSIRRGKEQADADVASRLYDRAVGMSVVKTHFSTHEGNVTAVEYLEQLPPDVKAMSFWLRNRQGDKWKEIFAHTDGDGEAFSIVINHQLHPDDQKVLDLQERNDNGN